MDGFNTRLDATEEIKERINELEMRSEENK